MTKFPKGQRCSTCRYHLERERPFQEMAHSGGNNFLHVTGFCSRFPPTIFSFNERMGSLPGVPSDFHWCGEYAPANPETVEEGAALLARLVLLGDLTAARALADKLKE